MPHIGAVMERSLQERSLRDAFIQLLSRSAVAAISKRQSISSVTGDLEDAKTAFSSWDNCMQASFCKWPVIAVMVIGGLIIFSIVWCIIRCCCCGLSCCCSCCQCLKCCGECCGMCDSPNKRHKHLDDPHVPQNQAHAYRSEPPMPAFGNTKRISNTPQYAVFDASDKKDADALPAMPTWDDAGSRKVLLEEESVEMEPLKKPDPSPTAAYMNANNMSHATLPSPVSPANRNPYGVPPSAGAGYDGYMASNHAEPNVYDQGFNAYNTGYSQQSYDNVNQGYAMAGAMAGGMAAGAGSGRTPHQDYNNGYANDGYGQGAMNQGYPQYPQSRTQRPYNEDYGRSTTPGSYRGAAGNGNGYANPRASPGPQAGGYGYGNLTRMASPGPQAGGYGARMQSPGPQTGGYGARMQSPGPQTRGYPQRSNTQDSYRQYPPPPARTYTGDSTTPLTRQYSEATTPTSPLQNSAGFDFQSGYARATPTPPPAASQTANGGKAYPGYRPYKAAGTQDAQQTNWNGY
ncbi:hypothetical protein F5Y15DRAFT_20452 [Xylariaceae sp. FL0016]|nr:hypothetical protein F5Y15DRAFT_20452 [Xylariaceae sp. FL0016]